MVAKSDLPTEIITARAITRRTTLDDLPKIAVWHSYPWPYDCFNMTNKRARSQSSPYWWQQIGQLDRCHYSVLLPERDQIIGVHAFVSIDWAKACVGNMGIRIRPDLCKQGYATETLAPLLKAVLDSGIQSIRLDVAATNQRAICCYQKCGMQIIDEFWLEHKGEPIDPDDPKWIPLMPHFQRKANKWMVRFHWMEIRKKGS